MLISPVALLSATLFTGAAFYITLVSIPLGLVWTTVRCCNDGSRATSACSHPVRPDGNRRGGRILAGYLTSRLAAEPRCIEEMRLTDLPTLLIKRLARGGPRLDCSFRTQRSQRSRPNVGQRALTPIGRIANVSKARSCLNFKGNSLDA